MRYILVMTLLIIFGLAVACTAETPVVEKDTKDTLAVVKDSAAVDSTATGEENELSHKIVAYYFHGTRRCATCKKIEAYTEEAVTGGFEKELASGQLEWHVVNTDEENNRHYMTDYKLYTKSLVITEVKDGEELRWKNLPKIWELVNSKDKFIEHVQSEITAFLEEK